MRIRINALDIFESNYFINFEAIMREEFKNGNTYLITFFNNTEKEINSIEEFEIFLASGNLRDAGWARQFHVMALANAGQIEEAKHHYQIWITEAKPSKRSEDYVAQVIQVAEQKYSTGAVKSGKAN